jgi:DedD protein
MAASQDTEITLGPGRVLAIFFGLAAVCALCFGLGYRMGSASAPVATGGEISSPAVAGVVRPSAARTDSRVAASTKSGNKEDKGDSSTASAAPSSSENSTPADADAPPPVGSAYYVQVAAVTKQEDAEALVEALKKKQYPALTANASPDKLFHVQVGPFADVKDAEAMRAKLMSDGYNPILKK